MVMTVVFKNSVTQSDTPIAVVYIGDKFGCTTYSSCYYFSLHARNMEHPIEIFGRDADLHLPHPAVYCRTRCYSGFYQFSLVIGVLVAFLIFNESGKKIRFAGSVGITVGLLLLKVFGV